MKIKAGTISRILFYGSLIFLAVYLIRLDAFEISLNVSRWPLLLAALALGVMGFLLDALAWKVSLHMMQNPCSFRDALHAAGYSIFGKYIPGKVWATINRVSLTVQTGAAADAAAFAGLLGQILIVAVGLVLGGGLLLKPVFPLLLKILAGIFIIGGAVLSLSPWCQRLTLNLLRRMLRMEQVVFRQVSRKHLAAVVLIFAGMWLAWGTGFMLLAMALETAGTDLTWSIILVFPLAATAGIIMLIAPGGLGVREGVMVILLATMGFARPEAAGLGLLARFWFLACEVIYFLAALAARPGERRKVEEGTIN
ncbi:lysylphosphatidylglycerol synthase domain-containing protein [Planctomycetota bacterium]